MMESSVNAGMCRCCASEGAFKDIKSTYHWMGEEEVYADMLRECFDIILNASEQAQDGGICEVCITQLRNAINFKKQVLHTEDQFQKHLQNKTLFRPNIVKVEVQAGDDSDDNVGSGDEGFSGPEFEVPIKTEVDDPKPKKRAAAKASATTTRASAKKAKADNGETSTKHKQEKVTTATNIKIEPKAEETIVLKEEHIKINPETAPRPRIKRLLHKHLHNLKIILESTNATMILKHGDKGYLCCYCTEAFQEPMNLKVHTLTEHQNAEKFYGNIKARGPSRFLVKLDITNLKCMLCSASIDALEDIFVHLTEIHNKNFHTDIQNQIFPFKFNTKELKCCQCSNDGVFATFSALHEHMHKHYRYFVCNECDAGFINHDTLSSHKVTHTKGTFACRHCPVIFDNVYKRRNHEMSSHSKPDKQPKVATATNFKIEPKSEVTVLPIEDHTKIKPEIVPPPGQKRLLQKHLNNLKIILETTNATMILKHGDKGYLCCYCTAAFQEPMNLKVHTLTDHENAEKIYSTLRARGPSRFLVKLDITNLKCMLCSANIDSLEDLFVHLTEIHNKKFHTDIQNQIFPFKFNTKQLKCYQCSSDVVFATFSALHEHMHKHYRHFVCNECDAGFINHVSLASHRVTHTKGTFACRHCPDVFDNVFKRKNHEMRSHSKAGKLHICHFCNEGFKEYVTKELHLTTVHGVTPRKYICSACDKSFASNSFLSAHVRSFHLMEKRHKCSECDKAFFRESHLKKHELSHTDSKCEICLKHFANKASLSQHMRVHNNDRGLKCKS